MRAIGVIKYSDLRRAACILFHNAVCFEYFQLKAPVACSDASIVMQ